MAKIPTMPRPQKSSAKAKAAVKKMKGAATKATTPSKDSDKMKAKKKTAMGKDSEAERHNPPRSAKSKADKSQETMALIDQGSNLQWRQQKQYQLCWVAPRGKRYQPIKLLHQQSTAPPKKTKVKEPAPQTDDHTFWKHFSELCQ
jgi:hypothetical protein